MCHQNHGVGVDYFALGIIAYEFMFGRVNIYIIYTINRGHMMGRQDMKLDIK